MTADRSDASRRVRALPIRVLPVPGEALDSWLEALAARYQSSWGDLLDAVGLGGSAGTALGLRLRRSLPATNDLSTISQATGVSMPVLRAMTPARGLCPGATDEETLDLLLPRSRFCPHCLADSGGRWQLWWRLRWAFVCPTHRCLLLDVCPKCLKAPRSHALNRQLVPTPGQCLNPALDAGGGGRNPRRCHEDLTAAVTVKLPRDHTVLDAQRTILSAIVHPAICTGIYRAEPVSPAQYLRDVKAVGMRALRYGSAHDLRAALAPSELDAVLQSAVDTCVKDRPHTAEASPWTAAGTAVAACVAVPVLSADSISTAGERMGWLIRSARSGDVAVNPARGEWARDTSATLASVRLSALTPHLKAFHQLKYRCHSSRPRLPLPPVSLHRSVPALFWYRWAAPVSDIDVGFEQLRLGLSTALMVTAGHQRLLDSSALVGGVISGSGATRVLHALFLRDDWTEIATMVTGLTDYLEDHPAPIDYERRRRLPTDGLLPEPVWRDISRRFGVSEGRGRRLLLMRCWLYERIVGSPGRTCPHAVDDKQFRSTLNDLPRRLFPELVEALDDVARQYLDAHGMDHEPVVWTPPNHACDDWMSRPRREVDIADLHRLVRSRDRYLGDIAVDLGTSIDVAREALNESPAPRAALTRNQRQALGAITPDARSQLRPELLAELYLRQGLSLKKIGTLIGVSKQTVTLLAREYGLPIRHVGRYKFSPGSEAPD